MADPSFHADEAIIDLEVARGAHGPPNDDEEALESPARSSSTRPARPPIPREVADMLGVTNSPLKPEQMAPLRKELPVDAELLDGMPALLAEDAAALVPPVQGIGNRSSPSFLAAGMASCRA